MFRAAYTAPFSSADVNTVTKTSSPQTSPSVPMLCEDGRPFLTDPVTGRRLCACHLAPDGAPSHLHPPSALPATLKTLAAPPPGSAPGPSPMDGGAAFYNPLLRGFTVRPERLAQCLTPSGPPLAFDPTLAAHPYGLLYAGLDVNGLGMRKAATRETTGPLKAWLHEHRKNPYPTKAEKIMLAIITKMTLTQVSTWFANARRRLKKESRLYTGPDNDHDDQDDDLHNKDDDDNNDTDAASRQLRDRCESDEDINVDISDVSDTEDVVTTTSLTHPPTAPTTTTTTTKHSPQSSSSLSSSSSTLSPFPTTPPFHPSFIPRPGPMPEFGLTRVVAPHPMLNGLQSHPSALPTDLASAALTSSSALSKGLDSHSSSLPRDLAGSLTLKGSTTLSNGSQVSTLPPKSSSSGHGGGSSPATSSKPKIWSISEIIHTDSPSPSAASSRPPASCGEDAQVVNSSHKLLTTPDLPPPLATHRADFLSQRQEYLSHRQSQEYLSHRLASPFRTLESPEVRLASRQASAFLVPGLHAGWGAPSVGALRLASACHAMNVANGNGSGEEGSVGERGGSPGSEGSTRNNSPPRNVSPQTEALDLHTKKDDKDVSLAST